MFLAVTFLSVQPKWQPRTCFCNH